MTDHLADVYIMCMLYVQVNTEVIAEEPEPLTLFPFELLLRTTRLSLELRADFPTRRAPDIELDVMVPASSACSGHRGNHSFRRQLECPGCGGNGGESGASRQCSYCGGEGHAQHLLRDKSRSYMHLASTTCHACGGKGVHPVGTCSQCRGRGFVLQEETVLFDLPVGWPHRYQLQYRNMGHQRERGGDIGGVVLTFHYEFPDGWSLAAGGGSGDLLLKIEVPVQRYTEGFTEHITTLDGRKTQVTILATTIHTRKEWV